MGSAGVSAEPIYSGPGIIVDETYIKHAVNLLLFRKSMRKNAIAEQASVKHNITSRGVLRGCDKCGATASGCLTVHCPGFVTPAEFDVCVRAGLLDYYHGEVIEGTLAIAAVRAEAEERKNAEHQHKVHR